MADITKMSPQTGRRLKEDNTVINTAEMIEAILAKIITAPATEAKQDTIITAIGLVVAALASVPVTNANLDIALSALRDALAGSGAGAKTLADLATLVGEVQASPTANTILARLKDIKDGIPLTGSNTRKWATDTILIGTGAAHSALDVVSTDAGEILQFETGLTAGQSGVILSSMVTTDNNAVFAGGNGYYLYLYSSSPTAQATNATFNMTTADLAKCVGRIQIGALEDIGDTCMRIDVGHNHDFTLAVADTKLYGKLVCIGEETTVSAKTITIKLGIAAL